MFPKLLCCSVLIFFASLLSYSCQTSTSGYACINGNCIPIADNAAYPTLELCEFNCDTANIGFDCLNGRCVQVGRDSAQYWYLNQCIDSCQ